MWGAAAAPFSLPVRINLRSVDRSTRSLFGPLRPEFREAPPIIDGVEPRYMVLEPNMPGPDIREQVGLQANQSCCDKARFSCTRWNQLRFHRPHKSLALHPLTNDNGLAQRQAMSPTGGEADIRGDRRSCMFATPIAVEMTEPQRLNIGF